MSLSVAQRHPQHLFCSVTNCITTLHFKIRESILRVVIQKVKSYTLLISKLFDMHSKHSNSLFKCNRLHSNNKV
jgi:hypothetical protein